MYYGFGSTRKYEVVCTCLDDRFKLPTYSDGFTCMGLAQARLLIKEDVQRILSRNINKGELGVFQGSHGTSISFLGKEVIRWEINYRG